MATEGWHTKGTDSCRALTIVGSFPAMRIFLLEGLPMTVWMHVLSPAFQPMYEIMHVPLPRERSLGVNCGVFYSFQEEGGNGGWSLGIDGSIQRI